MSPHFFLAIGEPALLARDEPVLCSFQLPGAEPAAVAIGEYSFCRLFFFYRFHCPYGWTSSYRPLKSSEFQPELARHPDRDRVTYVCQGIRPGFRTGLNPDLVSLQSTTRNMKSASEYLAIITTYLAEEISGASCQSILHVPTSHIFTVAPLGDFKKTEAWEVAPDRRFVLSRFAQREHLHP